MPADMTTAQADPGDAIEPDYAAKYRGLQTAMNKRHEELLTARQSAQVLTDELASAHAELDAYKNKDLAASEAAREEAQYEQLREKYEPPNPRPHGNNPQREQPRQPVDYRQALNGIFDHD
jgi:hypothetical protein